MFKLYSKQCEHAVQVLIAGKRCIEGTSRETFQAPEIARDAGLSIDSTRKTLYLLTQAGIIRSLRGPGGGYTFDSAINSLTLLDIVHAIDGENAYDSCILGLHECSDQNPCPVHKRWMHAKAQLMTQLRKTTVASMCANNSP